MDSLVCLGKARRVFKTANFEMGNQKAQKMCLPQPPRGQGTGCHYDEQIYNREREKIQCIGDRWGRKKSRVGVR